MRTGPLWRLITEGPSFGAAVCFKARGGSAGGLSCRGNMAGRFMPKEEARREVARIEALLKSQALPFAPIQSSIEVEKWVKYYSNPVFNPGSWEEKRVDGFSVGYHGGKYMMWYVGMPNNLDS